MAPFQLLLSAAAVLRGVSGFRPSPEGGVTVAATGHFQHVHEATAAASAEATTLAEGREVEPDSEAAPPEEAEAADGAEPNTVEPADGAEPMAADDKESTSAAEEADLRDVNHVHAAPHAVVTSSAGHDLVGHMIKIKWRMQSGETLGAISGYTPDTGQGEHYSILFPKAGEQLLKRDDFEELPSNGDTKALVGTEAQIVHIKDGAHSVRIKAAGVSGHQTFVIGEEDLESGGKIVMLTPHDFLTPEQVRKIHGGDLRDPREAQESADDRKARLAKERQHKAANRFIAGGKETEDLIGANLMNSEEWQKWVHKGDFSNDLKTKLGRELGDTGKEMDEAAAGVEKRTNAVQVLADKAKEGIKKYDSGLAGKAKMLGQLQYKGHALPIAATEKVEQNEAIRNAPMDIIRSLAEKHQQDPVEPTDPSDPPDTAP